ncbi:hypothetical protein V6N13_025069 [Hibiscus sabdariffa]|uniref:Uncharacterized protein n=2 Tax=Hibiscus sabdariffa TaxID=183260 RepID=A0ABR2A627_9ROSI
MRSRRRFVHCPADSVCRHRKNTPLSLFLLFSAQPRRKQSNRLRNKPLKGVKSSMMMTGCGCLRSNVDGFLWD